LPLEINENRRNNTGSTLGDGFLVILCVWGGHVWCHSMRPSTVAALKVQTGRGRPGESRPLFSKRMEMKKFTLKHVIGIRWEKFMKKGRTSIKDEEGGNPLHGVTKAKVGFVGCPPKTVI